MLKKVGKRFLANCVYYLYKVGVLKCDITVKSIDETIDALLNTEKSLVRFGDGEVSMIVGKDLKLEKYQQELAKDLKRIIHFEYDGLLVAINDVFGDLSKYRKESQLLWKDYLLMRRKEYVSVCDPSKEYYNSFVSRCYYIYADKNQCAEQFQKIREIWKNREIIVVEGVTTHNGVGNDLLDTAKNVERIIGPATNAYFVLDEIFEACNKYSKDKMILVSLGAAAKPLVERLFLQGYRVLDIGNLDMEYEWFLMKAENKVKLKKHEIIGEEANRVTGYDKYLSQIKVIIEQK